jgi:hypothetical protein
MAADQDALATLIAKDEIRELAMLYSRGVDRKDIDLLRTLYTEDGTDNHGSYFSGSASDYVDWLASGLPNIRYTGHHICNHLISVDGDEGNGEVYCIAFHILPDGKGGFVEDLMLVRYVDRYRKEGGRWRFASRVVSFDLGNQRPISIEDAAIPDPSRDPSVTELTQRLFARGGRG